MDEQPDIVEETIYKSPLHFTIYIVEQIIRDRRRYGLISVSDDGKQSQDLIWHAVTSWMSKPATVRHWRGSLIAARRKAREVGTLWCPECAEDLDMRYVPLQCRYCQIVLEKEEWISFSTAPLTRRVRPMRF